MRGAEPTIEGELYVELGTENVDISAISG
ncbi:hypothetical protein BN1723_013242 [Verticillium longisporum]|uniref:Uncharacterized protein n=1 Tax=Verticillium longisporum TaxID=100787 RepID=A0A0G4MFN2_VERLO|nr:hypothetical protein BN1723_013242 [Verticillium longisporum]CRK33019.1 hypothetical protein BN1708_005968 [Verticillium longisporum]